MNFAPVERKRRENYSFVFKILLMMAVIIAELKKVMLDHKNTALFPRKHK